MKINETLKWANKQLMQSCERPRFEAELLLAYHLKKERTYLHAFDSNEVTEIENYKALVERRANHEPYEYIVGEASFYDIELNVEAGVLIPRPETEILIDLVAEIIKEEKIRNIAEVGVGSGAISIVLARKFPSLNITATDICDIPIKVAKVNSQKYEVGNRIKIIKSNILDEVMLNELVAVDKMIELVVSNPPYIANDFELEKNVRAYEPKEALFGGRVGDELLKQIVLDVKAKGVKYLACEMGYDQKEPMTQFFNDIGVEYYKFYKDLAGFDRGFVIQFYKD
ncbi:MAG: Protein-N(5)-glutamine methyltransferase PrmC, methylates polypeptide chain release factors RF1 and RF2 [uncultured Sulfurovum sp.]|uniref:peptide chain release factor N(5)-glutamine methyltransferase n=1 Tax=uncultured Sulfurovum sp. TaxID=269237 RepID=A0A6S6SPB1_9BACT|nr:MAG: Protein-N(5)-glutamine methyltransferase PrmC, methylates polypeptide chain release factors RF1 and RF2 [uncultured Sulfurovum sp.]